MGARLVAAPLQLLYRINVSEAEAAQRVDKFDFQEVALVVFQEAAKVVTRQRRSMQLTGTFDGAPPTPLDLALATPPTW